ncbi:P-loop containing nucleoside triphosphate hydrolase [Glarea lozoyensis ATCC 20868]|uniref:p-loop containing nucleoside triphosphate hydrolase n=1 Tax=Glarea lozoyensis (strain ATCC 20868 / MF5171) TaxID=1116229 RepID=S3D1Z4_GLAL2|nr:P-loop containing nucleoside triphosphate hydrolase [Glarea lozoyensis ATCC 20868]EPE31810.1 P-loop containing nucleoside triphosphate hydrolase [Glarea lozoyensis ATCC 20868]
MWSRDSAERTSVSIAAAALAFISSLILLVLSYYEHTRSVQPSTLISVYLLPSLVFDAARTRTIWQIGANTEIERVFSASLVVKALLLLLESFDKSQSLIITDQRYGPEETGGFINRSLFFWMNRLIYTGYGRSLSLSDIYQLPHEFKDGSVQLRWQGYWGQGGLYDLCYDQLDLLTEVDTIGSENGKHPLIWSIIQALKWQLLQPILPRLFLIGFTISQPLLLLRIIHFLDASAKGEDDVNTGYGLVGAYGVVFLGVAISTAWYWHNTYQAIIAIRAVLVLAIYNKTIELDSTALSNSAAVTLMSADVERITAGLRTLHETWANVVQVAIASWLLKIQIGQAFIPPLVVPVVVGIITSRIGKAAGRRQTAWMGRVTSNMLGAVKGVKMSGSTERMTSNVKNLRLEELDASAKFRWHQVYSALLAFTPVLISPLLALATYTAITKHRGDSLDPGAVFTALALMTLISQPLSVLFQSVPNLMAAVACFDRIQNFLKSEIRHDYRIAPSPSISEKIPSITERATTSRISVTIGDESASLDTNDCLTVISIQNGSFNWGKDAKPILHNINLKIQVSKLTMIVGPVGSGKTTLLKTFLGEVPSSAGSVKVSPNNISFCDQTPWLTNRTVRENILGFSEFDSSWYSTVLHACALEEDLINFPEGDHSKLGSKGITLSGGQKQRVALARAIYARENLLVVDDILSGLDSSTESLVFARVFGPQGLLRRQGRTVILATHAVHLLPLADHIIVLLDGTVVDQGSFTKLQSKDSYVRSLGIEQPVIKLRLGDFVGSVFAVRDKPETPAMKQLDARDGDFRVWIYYFKAIGNMVTFLFFAFVAIYAFFYIFPLVWIKWWIEASYGNADYAIGKYIGIYALLQFAAMLALAAMVKHSFVTLVVSSGKSIHWKILTTTMRAPMLFFDKTDTGTTLNRFGQDLQIIDSELPMALMNMACSTSIMIGQILLIVNASYYLAISFPLIIVFLYLLQKVYLRTSRQLRMIDLEAKAPLYSHFVESLGGLATIRAFGWQQDVITLASGLLDDSQRPFYLLQCIQRWLTLVLDLFAMGFALILVSLILKFRHSTNSGFTGIALLNLMTLSAILMGVVTVWTQLETSIASVSRVKSFEKETPNENLPGEDFVPPKEWPAKGEIDVATGKALNRISVVIKAGEKIGIVGRTGSGKSSFVLALFRMLEIDSGSITIDGIDISSIPRHIVRSHLNDIPQEAYFLSGTVRQNVDPSGISSSTQIVDALTKVQLWALIEEKGGLDADFDANFLSKGQRQLFCLARAILRPGKIVVLDEATSSVDIKTDELMQRLIRSEFADYTIIAIAHRLNNLVGFDRIMVLDHGKLVECDNPKLLSERSSLFRGLLDTYKTGDD